MRASAYDTSFGIIIICELMDSAIELSTFFHVIYSKSSVNPKAEASVCKKIICSIQARSAKVFGSFGQSLFSLLIATPYTLLLRQFHARLTRAQKLVCQGLCTAKWPKEVCCKGTFRNFIARLNYNLNGVL